MRWPSSVSWACGRSRRNRSPPSSSSRCLMARVSDGCVTLHLSAALVKFSSLAVARKYLTCCISIAAVYHSIAKEAFEESAEDACHHHLIAAGRPGIVDDVGNASLPLGALRDYRHLIGISTG